MGLRALVPLALIALIVKPALAAQDCTLLQQTIVDADEHEKLETLLELCPNNAHLLHNIGVLYARQANWDIAADFFQRSLELYPLASLNLKQLQTIYRYQAVRAYRTALDSQTPEPRRPEFHFIPPTHTLNSQHGLDTPRLEKALASWWSEYSAVQNSVDTLSLPAYQVLNIADTSKLIVHLTEATLILAVKSTTTGYSLTFESSVSR